MKLQTKIHVWHDWLMTVKRIFEFFNMPHSSIASERKCFSIQQNKSTKILNIERTSIERYSLFYEYETDWKIISFFFNLIPYFSCTLDRKSNIMLVTWNIHDNRKYIIIYLHNIWIFGSYKNLQKSEEKLFKTAKSNDLIFVSFNSRWNLDSRILSIKIMKFFFFTYIACSYTIYSEI